MNSNVYFETKVGFAVDQLIPVFPAALILYLLFRFPEFTKHVAGLLKTSTGNVLCGFSLVTCAVVLNSVFSYFKVASLRAVLDETRYEVVTGCIENYSSETSPTNYRTEKFSIKNVEFEFSNFTPSRYFTGDDHTNNFITHGRCMEISYIRDDGENKILRIVQQTGS
ncbi:hypothetical protein L1285_16265 [Pseudoalteromonas sp. DL2-H2.2]|uniref:hypothetical protein n=1 Tax=Pseudoalteromonas sp. DL2-H2.2 TaxID=2908889 RepID=UPI001F2EA1AB|nr:hypothetical protein [Pseudoalteromonas sp. DL2-H2.2]MCF2909880.1 hypothetical protein [Pseudoalteromonas sp. DL2-H2.2]